MSGSRPKLERPKLVKLHRPKPGFTRPDFHSLLGGGLAEPTPNPLDTLVDEGDLESIATAEVSTMLAAIKAERKEKRDQYRTVADPFFYKVLVFQNHEQANQFITTKGWGEAGDLYLDGLAIAEKEGVPIEPIDLPMREHKARLPKLLRKVEVIR